jgi:hypothetical protein
MFERRLSGSDVRSVLDDGEEIASYPDDVPYPSCIMLGFMKGQAVHIVVAQEETTRTCYVITVYRPDPELWEPDFKRRRP